MVANPGRPYLLAARSIEQRNRPLIWKLQCLLRAFLRRWRPVPSLVIVVGGGNDTKS
jgi:hypothetical protein